MKRVLITGGAGFIGRALTEVALARGAEVVIFDNFTRNSLQYFNNATDKSGCQIVRGDIRDKPSLAKVVDDLDPDYVFHLAAIAGVSKYFSHPVDVLDVNITGTFCLLDLLKGRGSLKAVFDFSTSEIYGSHCYLSEEGGSVKMENLFEKRWTYATSKIASEKIGLAYHWQYDMPFVGVRPFNVYGPGQIGEGVISYMLNNVISNKAITITGDGVQSRTFCFIDDFLAGVMVLVDNLPSAIGSSFNIGTNSDIVTINRLVEIILEVAGVEVSVNYAPHKGEDVIVRSPSLRKINALGYKPEVSLREGVKMTLEWYKENQVALD
jgi:UDP-glucuronate decarboxylase